MKYSDKNRNKRQLEKRLNIKTVNFNLDMKNLKSTNAFICYSVNIGKL